MHPYMCVCVYVLYIGIKMHVYTHISTYKCKVHMIRKKHGIRDWLGLEATLKTT